MSRPTAEHGGIWHRSADPSDPDRPTWVEIFFDLVFVFALIHLMRKLAQHLTWSGVGKSVLLMMAISFIWVLSVWAAERLKPDRPMVTPQVIGVMAGNLVLATSVAGAFGKQGLLFAVVYVTIHLGTGIYYQLVLPPSVNKRMSRMRSGRIMLWESLAAVPWLVGGLMPGNGRWVLWTIAVVFEYLGLVLRWPTPWSAGPLYPGEHIAAERVTERYRQFVIIALGVSLFNIGEVASRNSYTPARMGALVVGFLTVALTWRIYISRADAPMTGTFATAARPYDLNRNAAILHLIIAGGIIGQSVVMGIVIGNPVTETRLNWVAFMLGSPAIFLAGRVLLERALFARFSWAQLLGFPLLLCLAPVSLLLPPVFVALIVAAVLACVAVLDHYVAPTPT